MENCPVQHTTTTMTTTITAGPRSRNRPKPGKTTAGTGNRTTADTTKSQPVRFRFVEPNCVTQLAADASSKSAQNDVFIINTPSTTKTDPNVRRFIRSHVMRGKNKKPHGGRKQTETQTAATPTQLEAGARDSASSSPLATRHFLFSQWIPKVVGSSVSFVRFAEPLPQSKVTMVMTSLTNWCEDLYPISMCVNLQLSDNWIEYLSKDKAYLNSMLFAAKCTADALENRGVGREATVYRTKALKFLQSNLNDKEMATTDTSISAVAVLVLAASGMGDFAEVGHHIGGMRHMIKLRGGISQLDHTQTVQTKVCKVDLSYALEKGEDPTMLTPDEVEGLWDKAPIAAELRELKNKCPKIKAMRKKDAESRQRRGSTNPSGHLARGAPIIAALCYGLHHEFLPRPNFLGRLTSIFDDLREFSDACNLSLRTGDKVSSRRFRDTLLSTQYRLAGLEAKYTRDLKDGSIPPSPFEIDLALVGMLVFGIVTFFHAEAVVFRYCHVCDRVRACLGSLSAVLPGLLQHHAIVMQDPQSAAARVSLQKLHLFLWFLFVINAWTFVTPDNQDLMVGLVSDILAALGLKSPHRGAGPAIRAVADQVAWAWPSNLSTTYLSAPGVLSTTTSHPCTPSPLDDMSFPPEYSYPPPPPSSSSSSSSSTTSATAADGWRARPSPNTTPSPEPPLGANITAAANNHFEAGNYYTTETSSTSSRSSTTSGDVKPRINIANTPRKSLEVINEHETKRIEVYKSHVSSHRSRNSRPKKKDHDYDYDDDDDHDGHHPPLVYIWDILRDHLWVDWVHGPSARVLAYKAFDLPVGGFGGYHGYGYLLGH